MKVHFLYGGATGVASMRRCQELPPCLTEPMAAGCMTELLLAEAKMVSGRDSTSVITYLRRGKKCNGVEE